METVEHFVLCCDAFNALRAELMTTLQYKLSYNAREIINYLKPKMLLYVLMGMNYTMPSDDLYTLRITSCHFINKMYIERSKYEKL